MNAWTSAPDLPVPGSRVIVVQEDDRAREEIAAGLECAGLEVACFNDPGAALDGLDASPLVVVSDHAPPALDGITFMRLARDLAPDAARILCAPVGDAGVLLDAMNLGGVERIIAKPWLPAELVSTVRDTARQVKRRAANASTICRLRDTNRKLANLVGVRTRALLQSLVDALSYRDVETHLHSLRVGLYARRLAEQLGIGEPQLSIIEQGALLHDIGKIGVRDEVLLKPGPLSPAERDEMQRHAELGWALLQRVEHLEAASLLVLQHHERWDGTGYPRGLRGDEITIGARLFRVVDSLDAMTATRPYRQTVSFAEARRDVVANRGTQFDPDVVDAFVGVGLGEWEEIRAESARIAAGSVAFPFPLDGAGGGALTFSPARAPAGAAVGSSPG